MPTTLLTSGVPTFQIPLSTPSETQARSVFTQLMWALSYPGRYFRLPVSLPGQSAQASPAASFNNCVSIAHTLLDLETTFFTPDAQLANALTRTGARQIGAESAAYHFYPMLTTLPQATALLTHAREALVGTLLYPDQAATLVVSCKLGTGLSLRLRGPGINGESEVRVGGLPATFWHLRAERVIYPLGWDLFLLDGDQVVGLPRTTVVEIDSLDSDTPELERGA